VDAIYLKADRQTRKLVVQQWIWTTSRRAGLKARIEEELSRFERFQLSRAIGHQRRTN